MNFLARMAVVLNIVVSIVASVFLIGFFSWCIMIGFNAVADSFKTAKRHVRHNRQATV